MSVYPRVSMNREQRAFRGARVAEQYGGVAPRSHLRRVGITRADVRSEVTAGRWRVLGRHTVGIGTSEPIGDARLWQVVWESGSGAVLDGVAALWKAGLSGYDDPVIDISLPHNCRPHRHPGVRIHQRRLMPETVAAGIPRVRPDTATVHAMQWARSDRAAVLLMCLAVQQRLVRPTDLASAWSQRRTLIRRARRELLDQAVRDVCGGAQSLGELDVVDGLRAAGLPEPSRQIVRQQAGGRIYLDLGWEDVGLFAEVDGGHHALALNTVDDALRANEVAISRGVVLRVPVLGYRVRPAAFIGQIVRAYWTLAAAPDHR